MEPSNTESSTETKRAKWRRLIDSWSQSGLSGKAWCRQQKLKYGTWMYWRHKFANEPELD